HSQGRTARHRQRCESLPHEYPGNFRCHQGPQHTTPSDPRIPVLRPLCKWGSKKVRGASSSQALHLKNAAVSLVLLIPLLLMLLALGAIVQQQRPGEEPVPPRKPPEGADGGPPKTLPHDQPPIIVLTEAEGYAFETGKADITPEFSTAL